jgi:SAM-dependent methyltransferase
MTSGTQGYERFIPLFIASSQALDFYIVCKDFVNFLPVKYSHVLDLGSGAGQNAAALDKLGFKITAVEPMGAFLNAAINTYKSTSIIWLNDSLPDLVCLDSHEEKFDFVLIDAVWHHLSEAERAKAASKIATVIKNNGRCALSLRNGPCGMGSKVFPINSNDTIKLFERYGFKCIFNDAIKRVFYLIKKKLSGHVSY